MTVEVEIGREPISGSLDDGNGSVTDFVGWLELMSAFELACARAATPLGPVPRPPAAGRSASVPSE